MSSLFKASQKFQTDLVIDFASPIDDTADENINALSHGHEMRVQFLGPYYAIGLIISSWSRN